MRLNRFYTERTNLTLNSSVKLQDTDIRHIRNVLRLKKNDEIVLFNGEKEYLAELKIVGREFITAKIKKVLKVEDFSKEGGIDITLFQSLIKVGNLDLIVEKTTEIGVDSIIAIESDFSQVKLDYVQKKPERWTKISIVAAKQSNRIKVPEIVQPITFKESLELADKFDEVFFFTFPKDNIEESKDTVDLKDYITKVQADGGENPTRIAFYVGPEGGFSPAEHKLAKEAGFKFVKFGNTILRSETAAISLLSILKYIYS